MALVQHRLDGIEQRCARRAELVLQCPVRPKEMARQRTYRARAGACAAPGPSTSTGTPSSPPAPTRARPTPRAGATRSSGPAPGPAPGCAGTSRASRTPPLRAMSDGPTGTRASRIAHFVWLRFNCACKTCAPWHLVEHMKTIVALLGVRKHLAHPRRNPTRRILDHHRQPQPLRLTLAQHPPTPPHRRRRQPEQIPRVEVHSGQHRLVAASSAPASTPSSEACATRGIDQHLLDRRTPSPRDRATAPSPQSDGWLGASTRHGSAKLRVIPPPPHPGATALQSGCEARFRRRPHRVHRGPGYLIRLTQRRLRSGRGPATTHTESSGKSMR